MSDLKEIDFFAPVESKAKKEEVVGELVEEEVGEEVYKDSEEKIEEEVEEEVDGDSEFSLNTEDGVETEEDIPKGKKYKLTKNKRKFGDCIITQIESLECFGDVQNKELGGWVESEKNLSHEGECWIDPSSVVLGNAKVKENAFVTGKSVVCDNAIVSGDAIVDEGSLLHDKCDVSGNATVENSNVGDSVKLEGDIGIKDSSLYGQLKFNRNEDFDKCKEFFKKTTTDTAHNLGKKLNSVSNGVFYASRSRLKEFSNKLRFELKDIRDRFKARPIKETFDFVLTLGWLGFISCVRLVKGVFTLGRYTKSFYGRKYSNYQYKQNNQSRDRR